MAPLTFHLLSLPNPTPLLHSLRFLPPTSRPLYVGSTHHWIHEPTLSTTALLGTTPGPTPWTHLLVAPSAGADGLALPSGINTSAVKEKWSIAVPVPETFIAGMQTEHPRRLSSTGPKLPEGWSPTNHTGLDASQPSTDLSASLALTSRPLGQTDPVDLKTFTRTFGTTHPGPVAMFNLLSYTPGGGREQYYGYIAAFSESVGIKYGGEPLLLGQHATAWSSKGAEEGGEGWDDCALVWYPSLWHFAKMLDDEGYVEADRRFKAGALRDNPLVCCTEIEVEYDD